MFRNLLQGASLPTTQSFINYVLLATIYGGIWLRSGNRVTRNVWYKYAALAGLDVEANYLVVLAYRYTSITSVTLLDCFTIPGALSFEAQTSCKAAGLTMFGPS